MRRRPVILSEEQDQELRHCRDHHSLPYMRLKAAAILKVAAGQTIIQALEAAGLDVLYDCQRGDCGICQCGVIEGVPDHRDVILSDDEKASNKVMQICVSRAKSERLVLDL